MKKKITYSTTTNYYYYHHRHLHPHIVTFNQPLHIIWAIRCDFICFGEMIRNSHSQKSIFVALMLWAHNLFNLKAETIQWHDGTSGSFSLSWTNYRIYSLIITQLDSCRLIRVEFYRNQLPFGTNIFRGVNNHFAYNKTQTNFT